ncbi:MAG: hypothetical protein GX797_10355 [Chloroflexi bacterium]|nr:hypothetical protein [Chloroflexota bacterium]
MPEERTSIQLSSAGIILRLKSSPKVLEEILSSSFLREYIPNLSFPQMGKPSFEIEVKNGDTLRFHTNKCSFAEITGLLGRDFSVEDLITVIEYCFELIRQNAGIYCMHASASCSNGKVVVLMGGASGIGKTKVNYLLVRNHGFKFVSDEKTLINKNLNVIGGISKIVVNKEILLKNTDIQEYGVRQSETITPIGYIFQPITVEGGKLFLDKWDANKANFHIYEELSRKIRGISRRINNFMFPLHAIDTKDNSYNRSELARAISNKILCSTIYGSPEEVAEFISNKVAIS